MYEVGVEASAGVAVGYGQIVAEGFERWRGNDCEYKLGHMGGWVLVWKCLSSSLWISFRAKLALPNDEDLLDVSSSFVYKPLHFQTCWASEHMPRHQS